jgi:PAS domain S-box-containing protein
VENAERKQVEAYSQFQANALAQVNDAVVAVDNQGRITYWNAGATALYGFQAAEVRGRRVAR